MLGRAISWVTGSTYNHVALQVDRTVFEITAFDGVTICPIESYGHKPSLSVSLPSVCVEIPEMLLNERINLLREIEAFVFRTLGYTGYINTGINCVTMVNIILNINLDTNEFTATTPDELLEQCLRFR